MMRMVFIICVFLLAFCPVTLQAETQISHYLENEIVNGIAIENNYIWCATDNGVVKFDKTTGNPIRYTTENGLNTNKILCVAIDHNGVKWFGTYRKGVSWFDGLNWNSHQTFNWAKVPDILSIAIDSKNTKWFLGPESWMTSYNGEEWIDTPGGGFDITIDSLDRIWIASGNPIVYLFDPALNNISPTTLKEVGEVEGWTFTAVAEDKNHVMWFGADQGVESFDGAKSVIYDSEAVGNMPIYIESIAVDKNNVKWFGTDFGLWSFDEKKWTYYNSLPDDESLWPYEIYDVAIDSDGTIWCAGKFGISSFHPDSSSGVKDSPSPAEFHITGISPNPFNPSTTISFSLPAAAQVNLAVYDITGRKVRTLISGNFSAGSRSAIWDGRDSSGRPVSSGVYIARLQSGKSAQSKKMLLMR
jgi:ligand-binding sensor domain-containing protein